ncbi:hypothetical protein PV779_55660 [Streptomyces sp. ID01-9D]|nr:hypothetical protein [Streptomyces sp. ID01-9D]
MNGARPSTSGGVGTTGGGAGPWPGRRSGHDPGGRSVGTGDGRPAAGCGRGCHPRVVTWNPRRVPRVGPFALPLI